MAALPSLAAPAAVPAPHRPSAPQRPRLAVVERPRHPMRFVVAGGVVVALAIFSAVALHALAAEASFQARALEEEVTELTMRQEELLADVARLGASERIREVATAELGMVPAGSPAYVWLEGDVDGDGTGPRLADPSEHLAGG